MLTAADVLAQDAWLARRFRYDNVLSLHDAREGITAAQRLAAAPIDEPAALFFVFVRLIEQVADAWMELPQALAKSQARQAGLMLDADREELRALRFAIMTERLPFEQVRAWFQARLRPMG